mmetsp:Transcript_15741/g.22386  ORF Transcript_15741/g.22386 Transcript_15741/m.22386 type:complete len:288 (-) Transcript_15741:892-1755(-)
MIVSFGKLSVLLALILKHGYVHSFTAPHRRSASLGPLRSVSTVDTTSNEISTNNLSIASEPKAWECDEDANCVLVDACDDDKCRTSLDVRIHGQWYDLSGWRKAHPAGAHWIDWYDGRDATEVMDAFHSEKARQMFSRLPKSSEEISSQLDEDIPADSPTQVAFRKLRDQLEADGWWERDYFHEAKLLAIWAGLYTAAVATAHTAAPLSIMLTALAMTNSGWLGHDYIHGVDKFSERMRLFVAVAGGLGPTWWSDKVCYVSHESIVCVIFTSKYPLNCNILTTITDE